MSEVLIILALSLVGVRLVLSVSTATLPLRRRGCVALTGCLMLFVAGEVETATTHRQPAASLKFEMKVVDTVTGKPKSKFFLGETVSVKFTLTNHDRLARTLTELQDTEIPVKLDYVLDDEDPSAPLEGVRGGTGGSYVNPDGTVIWTSREPDQRVLAPGQSVSVKIDDLGRFFARRLQNGTYTLTAVYDKSLKVKVSFRIVIDEAKSIPALEKMTAAPIRNGDESDRNWAKVFLREIRQPSIGGRITTADGKALKEVFIYVTGSEKTNIETRSNGRYHLTQMIRGGTYTLIPSLEGYTFRPSSRTMTNLNSEDAGRGFHRHSGQG